MHYKKQNNHVPIVSFDVVSSTMDVARTWVLGADLPEHVCAYKLFNPVHEKHKVLGVFIAKEQTCGKGRHGNKWHSPVGAGVFLTVLLGVGDCFVNLNGLSLAIGVSLVDAIKSYGCECKLKWPNDIVAITKSGCGYRKLGGILIETFSAENGVCSDICSDVSGDIKSFISIGLGVNVCRSAFSDDALYAELKCVSLDEESYQFQDIDDVASKVLESVISCLRVFLSNGFINFRDSWLKNSISIGRCVYIKDRENKDGLKARVIDVDDCGELIVSLCDSPKILKTISSGVIWCDDVVSN